MYQRQPFFKFMNILSSDIDLRMLGGQNSFLLE